MPVTSATVRASKVVRSPTPAAAARRRASSIDASWASKPVKVEAG